MLFLKKSKILLAGMIFQSIHILSIPILFYYYPSIFKNVGRMSEIKVSSELVLFSVIHIFS